MNRVLSAVAAALLALALAATPVAARPSWPDIDTSPTVSSLRCDFGVPSDPVAISGSTDRVARARAAPSGSALGEQRSPALILAVDMPDGTSYERAGPPAQKLTRCVFDAPGGTGAAWVFFPLGMPVTMKGQGKTRL